MRSLGRGSRNIVVGLCDCAAIAQSAVIMSNAQSYDSCAVIVGKAAGQDIGLTE